MFNRFPYPLSNLYSHQLTCVAEDLLRLRLRRRRMLLRFDLLIALGAVVSSLATGTVTALGRATSTFISRSSKH